jgi:hypothetical protein
MVLLALAAITLHFDAIPRAEASSAELMKTYTNAAYGFVVKMPRDFSAYPPDANPLRDEAGAPTGEAIVLRNMVGEAVHIVVFSGR